MAIIVENDTIKFNGTPKMVKESITQKFLDRGDRSARQIADEAGVTIKTLYNWVDKYAMNSPMKKKRYTSFEKMQLIIKYDLLSEEDKGIFLRQYGLYSETIEEWREKTIEGSFENITESILRKQVTDKNEKLKALEKELRRKDRALAETAALLVLKKKAGALFGDDEDEE